MCIVTLSYHPLVASELPLYADLLLELRIHCIPLVKIHPETQVSQPQPSPVDGRAKTLMSPTQRVTPVTSTTHALTSQGQVVL